jgi:hypothetical protein
MTHLRQQALTRDRDDPKGLESAVYAGHVFSRLSGFPNDIYDGGVCPMNLSAHSMKYFMFGASVWPPSCCRHASCPSSSPWFTAGIFAAW